MIDICLKGLDTLRDKLISIKEKRESSNNVIDIRSKLNNSDNKNGNNKNKKFKLNIKSIGIIAALFVIAIFLVWALVHKNSYQISIGGSSVGFIKEAGLEKDIYNTAVAQLETAEGTIIKLDPGLDVTSTFARASKKDFVTVDYVVSQIKAKMTYTIEASVISVDGVEIGILKNKEAIDIATNKILDEYTLENAQIVTKEFVEKIDISKRFVPKTEIINSDDLYKRLTEKKEIPQTYEIKSGDSLWLIANNAGLTLTQMLKINPGIDENTILKIGQKLNLVVPKPALSVKIVSEIKYTETIPYSVEYQTDDSQFKTYKQVLQEGKDGTKEITANVVYVNGYKEETEIVGEPVVTLEPIVSIIVTGTKALPAKSATGSFRRPISGGTISSYFGSRWGSYHNALDIAAPGGTTIYASDGGTVKTAGWNGSYGNLVTIDHGNGFETYYGHCSKLFVTAGQKVAKGEKIAAVGSTGNSTGNHVHFEVRKDGTPTNPLNYIK